MFCFLINVHNEPSETILKIVSDIKKTYIEYDIVIIYDGVKKIGIENVIEIEGDRLKYPYNDGRWTQRYLSEFINKSNAQYLIKLDPDCDVMNEYILPKEYKGVFGYLNLLGMGPRNYMLQGGRYGIHRDSVKKVIESELLLSDFKKYNNIQDLMMTDVLHKLNVEYSICKDLMDSILHKKRGSEECRLYTLKPSKYSLNRIRDVKETS